MRRDELRLVYLAFERSENFGTAIARCLRVVGRRRLSGGRLGRRQLSRPLKIIDLISRRRQKSTAFCHDSIAYPRCIQCHVYSWTLDASKASCRFLTNCSFLPASINFAVSARARLMPRDARQRTSLSRLPPVRLGRRFLPSSPFLPSSEVRLPSTARKSKVLNSFFSWSRRALFLQPSWTEL